MVIRTQRRISRATQQCVERRFIVELGAHRQRVREEADRVLHLGLFAPRHRRSHDDVLVAGLLMQHRLERSEKRHVQRRIPLTADAPQRR